MKIAVDTSVIVDFLRRSDKENSLYSHLSSSYNIIISLISVAELYSGQSSQTKRGSEALSNVLIGVEIKAPNLDMAKFAGNLKLQYDLSLPDAFIATMAIDSSLPLATFNRKDFEKIKRLKLYLQNHKKD